MNWERRKQSENWVREKANEFVKLNSELTFAEWCYQQGKKDGAIEFAYYMKNVAHIDVSEYLYEYEKEKANG